MQKLYSVLILLAFSVYSGFAQDKEEENLGVQEVNIVKPYAPSISDAFKIKDNPTLKANDTLEKQKINYKINSIPVASTFTPSKGKAKGQPKLEKEISYPNYVSVGFGNNTTPLIEAYLQTNSSPDNTFEVHLNHISSKGNVKDAILNSNFMDTKGDLFYKQQQDNFNWMANLGIQHQLYNWYGLDSEKFYSNTFLDNISENQTYLTAKLDGTVSLDDSPINQINLQLRSLNDRSKSNELRLFFNPTFKFPISSEVIHADFSFEFINGAFKQGYYLPNQQSFGFMNIGLKPSIKIQRDELSLSIGVKGYYASDTQHKESDFLIYPNILASYNIVKDIVTLFGELTGDLQQNSYYDFFQKNPFVSPTLNIKASNQKYKGLLGIKGKASPTINYNLEASYANTENHALFVSNQSYTDGSILISNSYQAGNSFGVIYDQIKTLGVRGSLEVMATKELSISSGLNYNSYTTEIENHAYNLPNITGEIEAKYKSNNWSGGANLFYIGTRKEKISDIIAPFNPMYRDVSVDGYFDVNLNLGYQFTKQLSTFINGNNLLGNNYERFHNFNVQGIQVLGGVSYKFDM